MATSCDNWLPVQSLANNTGKRYVLQHGVLIVILFLHLAFVDICDYRSPYFLALSDVLPLSIELPALLVVASIVKEFTILTKTTEASLFEIFAYIRRKVGYCGGTDIRWCLDW